jgi:hypothetical protein
MLPHRLWLTGSAEVDDGAWGWDVIDVTEESREASAEDSGVITPRHTTTITLWQLCRYALIP